MRGILHSSFEPIDFELRIDKDGLVAPYSLPLPDGGTLQIKGSIDRVDRMERDGKAYLRVVDYKSGGKEFLLSDVLNGLNMQMLIYLMCLWQMVRSAMARLSPQASSTCR